MWSYKIQEITKPSLLSIRVQFALYKDNEVYLVDEASFDPDQLSQETLAEKEQIIRQAILQRIAAYTQTDGLAGELADLVGVEVALTGDRAILARELTNDPLGVGYVNMTTEQKLASLNAKNRTVTSMFITVRTLLSALDPITAATIVGKLEAVAASNKVIELALKMLNTYTIGGGIDIAHPNTIAFIDYLASQEVLTVEEATAIKDLTKIGRAYELIGRDAAAEDIV